MKKALITIQLALTTIACFSQPTSKTNFLEDLEFLKKTLPVKHTNLFAKIDRGQFENKIDQIAMRSNGFDQNRFIVELFRLTKSIGDEHTFVEADFTKILPIQFGLFKEGLFVVAIDSANKSVLNSKLKSINGHPVTEILVRLEQIIQTENPSYFNDHLLHHLSNPTLLNGLELIDNDLAATFTLSTPDSEIQTITLKSVAGKDAAKLNLVRSGRNLLSNQKEKGNYWFDYNEDKKTLYFSYNECRQEPDNPFAKFNGELFSQIAARHPEKIVLDLRYNNGGNSGVLTPFVEKIKDSYLNQKGKFFVLIGKQTFSSAVMNAVELKRNSNAIFIGEPTSGNINHYGEVRGFSLPQSGVTIAYSTRYWETWKGKKGPLKPDIQVKYSIKNYTEGKDEALMQVYKN